MRRANSPVFHSNIVLNHAGTAAFGGAGSTPDLDYNDYFNNSDANVGGTIGSIGSNSLTVDPMLQGNYTLENVESPVMNAGDPSADLLEDYEGDIRPSHQNFDMGADEIGGCFAKIVEDSSGRIYGSVQWAVNDADEADTVLVDGTCYGVNTNASVTQHLYLDKPITLDGDWEYESEALAILDAQEVGRVVYAAPGADATMWNFRFRYGDASLGGGADTGGGVLNDGGTLSLLNTNVFWSAAADGGGIANASGGNLTLGGVHMFQNTAEQGGGFYMASGTATINRGDFYNNNATDGAGSLS